MAAETEDRDERPAEAQEQLLTEGQPVALDDVLVEAAGGGDPNEETGETLLPISGMVRLTGRELEVISHPAFQRLFEIFQLGQANLVYRGATHMRGEHAIGTVKVAMQIVEAIRRNRARGPIEPSKYWRPAAELTLEEIAFIRLSALMHDIGHLPAGHTLEDELGLLPHHDGDDRINLILDKEEWHGRPCAPLRSLIDDRYLDEAASAAQIGKDGNPLSASELLLRLISSDHTDARTSLGTTFRVKVCRDVVGNTICADLIDYLHRDWIHLGKPREFDPRLLDYMYILVRTRDGVEEQRLVIHLGERERPRSDAVTAILDLLESRYQLSEIALFHRVKLAATGMLERAIAEYRDSFLDEDTQRDALQGLIPDLLECSDVEVLKLLERRLMNRGLETDLGAEQHKRVEGAVDLVRRLRVRYLHRGLQVVFWDSLPEQQARQVAELYSGGDSPSTIRQAAENRLRAVRALEGDFGLEPCSIVMYCPPLQMNSKIAEVGIFSNGLVDTLAQLDEQDERITGGHLKAQQRRFRRLWRVSFALDREAYARLEEQGILSLLKEAITRMTLWVPDGTNDADHDAVRRMAETLSQRQVSPWYEHPIVEPAMNREQESFEYPGGAPSIRSFIGPKPRHN